VYFEMGNLDMAKARRLIWQLYPSYFLVVLVSLLAAGWYTSKAMQRFYLDQSRINLVHQARLLVHQFLPLLQQHDLKAIDALCKARGKLIPQRLTVILPNGVVAGDSESDPAQMENHGNRQEVRNALQGTQSASVRFSVTLGQQMMYAAIPIGDDPPNGIMRVSIATSDLDKVLHHLQTRLVLGGLVIALAAAVVCLVIARRISRPIEIMRQGAARFAEGDLAHRLAPPSTVELAGLAEAMNQMAKDLESRIQTVIRQRNETQAVLSSMMEGIIALDLEEKVLDSNQSAMKMLRQSLDQIKGRSIQEIIRNRELHEILRQTLTQGTKTEADITLHRQVGLILNVHISPLVDADGKRIGALLVMNDVTQLRRLENMRRDFAANVSHEIKTPLTAIQGFVETLHAGKVEDPAERSRFLGIIHKHVMRLSAIIDDLMKLSRLEQDDPGMQLRLEPHEIKKMLATAVQLCGHQAAEKQITIGVDCDEHLSAEMDVDLMEQAALNLLDNAIKYSPTQSQIQISVELSNDIIDIHFQDQGPGIAPKHLSRLFERFYRVDTSRSRKMGGTGLGLAIVKHIAQAHHGQVRVESHQGKGSSFTLSIPAHRATS
jgi:two-component system phosphate regulon sensor histidine kinase PhoR